MNPLSFIVHAQSLMNNHSSTAADFRLVLNSRSLGCFETTLPYPRVVEPMPIGQEPLVNKLTFVHLETCLAGTVITNRNCLLWQAPYAGSRNTCRLDSART